MNDADEARRIAPLESYGTLCTEIAAALAAAHAAGERSGIERAAALFSFETKSCATDRYAMHMQELCSCEAVSNAIRALLSESSGISGELPAEPAAKCSRGDKGCGETPCVCK